MNLPPIRIEQSSPAPMPPRVQATVEQVVGPQRYVLSVQGLRVEASLPVSLAAGDVVSLTVREQTAQSIVLEWSPPPAVTAASPLVAPYLLEEPALAPEGPRTPASQAAAFLATHGVNPTNSLVASVAALAQQPPGTETASPLLQPLAEALNALIANAPGEVAERLHQLAGPPPDPAPILRGLLDASPRLAVLDRLIEFAASATPQDAPPEQVSSQVEKAMELVRQARTGNVEQAIAQMPKMSAEALRQLTGQLLEMERGEIAALPELAAARAARGTVLAAAERQTDLRLMNQLAQVRGDGIQVLEIPVRLDGRLQHIPLRMRRERSARGGAASDEIQMTLDVQFSRLGPVRANMVERHKALQVRFQVRDDRVEALLTRTAPELVEALRARGLATSTTVQVAPAAETFSILDFFAEAGDAHALDFEA